MRSGMSNCMFKQQPKDFNNFLAGLKTLEGEGVQYLGMAKIIEHCNRGETPHAKAAEKIVKQMIEYFPEVNYPADLLNLTRQEIDAFAEYHTNIGLWEMYNGTS